jgi:hypothetical protein
MFVGGSGALCHWFTCVWQWGRAAVSMLSPEHRQPWGLLSLNCKAVAVAATLQHVLTSSWCCPQSCA